MNLCPCGARGDPAVECSCSPQRLAAFRDKLSRALLDRFDLVVTVPRPRAARARGRAGRASAPVAERVGRRARAARASPPGARPRPTSCSPRGRAAAALGPRSRAGRARRAYDRRAGRRGRGAARARRRGARRTGRRGSSTHERARRGRVRGRDGTRISSAEPRSARFPRGSPESSTSGAYLVAHRGAGHPLARPLAPRFLVRWRRSSIRPSGCSCAATRTPSCSTGRRSQSSAHALALRTAPTSRGRSVASSLLQASSSSAAWRAASTARRIAARSRPAERRSPCSAAASTATIRPRTPSSRDGSRERGPHRLRVRAGRRARAVAFPGAQPDHRGACRRDRGRRGA